MSLYDVSLLLLLLLYVKNIESASFLTGEQRNWLLGISRGNNSIGLFPAITPNQTQLLEMKNELFMNETIKYHLPYNYAVDIVFSNYNQTKIIEYQDCGDSAFWTAHWIAYLVHRWNMTLELDILNDISLFIESYYNLVTCAEREGYLVRIVGPENDVAYKAYYNNDGYHCSDNSRTLNSSFIWLGSESRDQYFGANMFLTVIWTFVNNNESITDNNIIKQINNIRNMVIIISELIINDLYENDWWIINSSPDIQVPTRPVPSFKCVWMRLAMSINPNKYTSIFREEYDKNFKEALISLEFDVSSIYHSAYFANNLCIVSLSSLTYLETNITKLIILFNRLQEIGSIQNKIHLQASFSSWFLSNVELHKYELKKLNITQINLENAQGLLQGILLDFPDNKWEKLVNQETNSLYFPHYNNQLSKYALLPYDRPYDTFMWQRSPAKLTGGTNNIPLQYQMTDFLLPYWISKYIGLL